MKRSERHAPPRVTFFCVGDAKVPSTRLRVLNYLPILAAQGVRPHLVLGGSSSRLKRGLTRAVGTLKAGRSDHVFIQKITLPVPQVRWLKRQARIIYDFDDAIHLRTAGSGSDVERRLTYVLRHCDLVVAGNRVLKEYAARYNPHVAVLPTPVSGTITPDPSVRPGPGLVLGWIGSAHNLYNLDPIRDVLAGLMARNPGLELHLVSDGHYGIPGLEAGIKNIPWSLDTESRHVSEFDVGIMPLVDSPWNRGKCAFKAIQMMAHGKAVVASPVGMNRDVIHDGINGLLAASKDQWRDAVQRLVDSESLRRRLGESALRTVSDRFTVHALGERFCRLFTVPVGETCGSDETEGVS